MTKQKLAKIADYIPIIGDILDFSKLLKRRKDIFKCGSHPIIVQSHLEDAESVFRNKVFNRYAPILGVAITIGGLYSCYDMQKYVSLKNRAEQIADTNHDGRLDCEERKRFYTEVGMPFKTEIKEEQQKIQILIRIFETKKGKSH